MSVLFSTILISLLLLLLLLNNTLFYAMHLMGKPSTQNLHADANADLSKLLLPSVDYRTVYEDDDGVDQANADDWHYLQGDEAQPYAGLSEAIQLEADLLRLQKWRQTKQQQQQRQKLWLEQMLEEFMKEQQLKQFQQHQQRSSFPENELKQKQLLLQHIQNQQYIQEQGQPVRQHLQQQQPNQHPFNTEQKILPPLPSSEPHPQQSDQDALNEHNQVDDNITVGKPDTLYTVPQIKCPTAMDGMERFACPTPDLQGRYRCIDDHVLCDGFIDCPEGEDEDRKSCMFHKTDKAHIDVLADALLRWARGR